MILMFLVGAGLCVIIVGAFASRSGVKRATLASYKQQVKILAKAHRNIVNGSANPVLESQIALDEYENKQSELE